MRGGRTPAIRKHVRVKPVFLRQSWVLPLLPIALAAPAWAADDATKAAPVPATDPDPGKVPADPGLERFMPWVSPYRAPPVMETPPPPPRVTTKLDAPPAHSWKHTATVGAHINAVTASHEAARSGDPTISGGSNTESYLFTGDGTLKWAGVNQSFDQTVSLHYGRQRVENQSWLMNDDLIHYDAIFREDLSHNGFLYFNDGLDSVFQGPANEDHPLDPIKIHAGAGYGQRYKALFVPPPAADKIEWHLGFRVQKEWSRAFDHNQAQIEYGPETFVRYEVAVGNKEDFFVQDEGFLDASDPSHIEDLVTAGLTMKPLAHLNVELGLRGYYETKPKFLDPNSTVRYDHWGLLTNTHIGVILDF